LIQFLLGEALPPLGHLCYQLDKMGGYRLSRFFSVITWLQVECPKCKVRFPFRRRRTAHFDRHGFESYELACAACGVLLAGVIDPFDGTLVLSALEQSKK